MQKETEQQQIAKFGIELSSLFLKLSGNNKN